MFKKSATRTYVLLVLGVVALVFGIFLVYQFFKVQKAHSTFENYYAFQGCRQLLSRTGNDAVCRTDSGQVIKIVKYNNKWYLDGDLPVCYFSFCI